MKQWIILVVAVRLFFPQAAVADPKEAQTVVLKPGEGLLRAIVRGGCVPERLFQVMAFQDPEISLKGLRSLPAGMVIRLPGDCGIPIRGETASRSPALPQAPDQAQRSDPSDPEVQLEAPFPWTTKLGIGILSALTMFFVIFFRWRWDKMVYPATRGEYQVHYLGNRYVFAQEGTCPICRERVGVREARNHLAKEHPELRLSTSQ